MSVSQEYVESMKATACWTDCAFVAGAARSTVKIHRGERR
jgi:hypothetical protein